MSGVPQVIVSLAPNGKLVVELPGFQATRHKIEMRNGDAEGTLKRILEAQLHSKVEIGLDGHPTNRQVQHWERHEIWPKENCPFCISEGRIAKGISTARRKEFVSDGTVQIKRLKPKESGLPPKTKAKKRPTVTLHAKTDKTADDLGL